MSAPAEDPALGPVAEFFASPRFSSALTLTSIGTAVLSTALTRTIGWAGLITIVVGLVALSAVSLAAQRQMIKWQGLLPLSLLIFLAWTALSLVWSQYQWVTLGGLAYLAAFTVLGLYVALTRDTIQIVRAFGDVLRVVLAASLVLEIVSGVLIDSPIRFLGIAGDIDQLGPIQGLMGTRNELGFVAVLAAITFGTEYRTKSVSRELGIGSLVLAAASILLSRSPVVAGVAVVVAAAAGALYSLRRLPPERRTLWQVVLLVVAGFGTGAVWLMRGSVIDLFNATGALDYRLDIWRRLWGLIGLHPLEGWGWVGPWPADVQPFPSLANAAGRVPGSGLNAYLDVWFQLGLVGVALFVGLLGLAFVRSWLLAGRKRSFVFAWPALALVALLVTSLAESTMLADYGWLIFVVCCVKAARELSWRSALRT